MTRIPTINGRKVVIRNEEGFEVELDEKVKVN